MLGKKSVLSSALPDLLSRTGPSSVPVPTYLPSTRSWQHHHPFRALHRSTCGALQTKQNRLKSRLCLDPGIGFCRWGDTQRGTCIFKSGPRDSAGSGPETYHVEGCETCKTHGEGQLKFLELTDCIKKLHIQLLKRRLKLEETSRCCVSEATSKLAAHSGFPPRFEPWLCEFGFRMNEYSNRPLGGDIASPSLHGQLHERMYF